MLFAAILPSFSAQIGPSWSQVGPSWGQAPIALRPVWQLSYLKELLARGVPAELAFAAVCPPEVSKKRGPSERLDRLQNLQGVNKNRLDRLQGATALMSRGTSLSPDGDICNASNTIIQ